MHAKQFVLNINEHETSSEVISFGDMNFCQSTTEHNNANDSSFPEDEEEEANVYMIRKEIHHNYKIQVTQCFFHHVIMGSHSQQLAVTVVYTN